MKFFRYRQVRTSQRLRDETLSCLFIRALCHQSSKTMQSQHSISVTSKIRRALSGNMLSHVRSLNIFLNGEITEKDIKAPAGFVIKMKGQIVVSGEVSSSLMLDKIISAVSEKAEGRAVQNMMTIKRL